MSSDRVTLGLDRRDIFKFSSHMPYNLLSRRIAEDHFVMPVCRGLEVKGPMNVYGLLLSFHTQTSVVRRPLRRDWAAAIFVSILARVSTVEVFDDPVHRALLAKLWRRHWVRFTLLIDRTSWRLFRRFELTVGLNREGLRIQAHSGIPQAYSAPRLTRIPLLQRWLVR